MIEIKNTEKSTLLFDINVDGIDPGVLEYNFRIYNEDTEIGFKGIFHEGEVIFNIPPLSNIITEEALNGTFYAKLEINDANEKYYMRPYMDEVRIEKDKVVEAKVKTIVSEEKKVSVNVSPSIKKPKKTDEDIELSKNIDTKMLKQKLKRGKDLLKNKKKAQELVGENDKVSAVVKNIFKE